MSNALRFLVLEAGNHTTEYNGARYTTEAAMAALLSSAGREALKKVSTATLSTVTTHGRASAGPGERIFLVPQRSHAHLFDAASGARL